MTAVVGSLLAEVAVDKTGLTAGLRAAGVDLTNFENRSTRQFQRVEAGFKKVGKSATAFSGVLSRSLVPSLGALTGALSLREVSRYADAWTGAKNSLAVAGVTGKDQVAVLNSLYAAAQKNAAPVTALADLYGKAAQASDNLGASQADLLKFSGGVATALRVAGASASQASGALTQLGQLLGSARVQAEEFNSVNEGARPILTAVAHGLDEAGGSVNRLKQLVNDGKVSGKQFFEAFLKGLPEIEKMAANATTTIDQGWTKVSNALTKYIGETDSSLGASQRLVKGLSALADNFDETADLALNLASVIAGALIGRSIIGLISKLALGTQALIAFGRAVAAARTASLATAFAGLGSAAGPIGAIIGAGVVGALVAFTGSSEKATAGAKTYADALKEVEDRAKGAKDGIEGTTAAIDEQTKNQLSEGVDTGIQKIEEAREAALKLFQDIIDNAPRRLITDAQLKSLQDLHDGLENGSTGANDVKQALYALANSNPSFQALADQMSPLLDMLNNAIAATDTLRNRLGSGGPSFRESENASMDAYGDMKAAADKFIAEATRRNSLTKEQLALEKEVGNVRNDALKEGITLTDAQVKNLAAANIAAEKARSDAEKATNRATRRTERIANIMKGIAPEVIRFTGIDNPEAFWKGMRDAAASLGRPMQSADAFFSEIGV
jgi:tape measure domain-containing protein